MDKPRKIEPAKGKLGVLTPGMGAVSTTFMAGVELVRKGKSQPVGSLTQLGTIRLGKRTDGRSPLINQFVPLSGLNDIVFGGWDIYKDNAFQSAANAGGIVTVAPVKFGNPLSVVATSVMPLKIWPYRSIAFSHSSMNAWLVF